MWSQIFHTGAQAQQSLEQLRREDGIDQLLLGFILSCHIPQHGQVSTAQLPNPALGLFVVFAQSTGTSPAGLLG